MQKEILERDVYQANPLIRAKKEMNLTEMRLFALGLQDITPHIKNDVIHDLEFHETKITYNELKELFGTDHNGNITNLKKQVEKAYDAKIKLSYQDGGFGFRHIYKKMDYIPQEGLIILFDDEIKEYILNIANQQFTRYKLKAVFALSSTYAWRILEIILENQGYFKQGKKEIYKILSIEEIRFKLNIADGLYAGRMDNFKRKVIVEPIEDINKKTDYYVWFEPIKTGKKITGFKFWLKMKDEIEALPAPTQDIPLEEKLEQEAGQVKLIELPAQEKTPRGLSDEEQEAYDSLVNRGVAIKKAKELAKNYELKRIKRNLEIAVRQKDTSRNLPGLIISMIEQDTVGQQEIAKQEARARIEARQKDRRQAYDTFYGTNLADIGRARADKGEERKEEAPEPKELSEFEVNVIIQGKGKAPKPFMQKMEKLGLTYEDVKAGRRK